VDATVGCAVGCVVTGVGVVPVVGIGVAVFVGVGFVGDFVGVIFGFPTVFAVGVA
jgi:hypothetical protein